MKFVVGLYKLGNGNSYNISAEIIETSSLDELNNEIKDNLKNGFIVLNDRFFNKESFDFIWVTKHKEGDDSLKQEIDKKLD